MRCEDLQPALLWQILTEIYGSTKSSSNSPSLSIPQKIKQWITKRNQIRTLNLELQEDSNGNLFIRKHPTPGWEYAPSLLLHAHFDLGVNEGIVPNSFDKQAKSHSKPHTQSSESNQIKKKVICSSLNLDPSQEWFEIEGSPIFDDSVVGVALILAVLTDVSGQIQHGPLEALFTVKKGSQFIGALQLDPKEFSIESRFLLNFDAVDLASIINGTAGCAEFIIKKSIFRQDLDSHDDFVFYKLQVNGLQGGDLGSEIHFLRGNALKIAARCLSAIEAEVPIFLGDWAGGHYYRFIPQSCAIIFAVKKTYQEQVLQSFRKERHQLIRKYKKFTEYGQNLEPNLHIKLEETQSMPVLSSNLTSEIIALANWIPQGLIQKTAVENDLDKISHNFAKVEMNKEHVIFYGKSRGDNAAELSDFHRKMRSLKHFGWEIINDYDFPVWEPSPPGSFLKFVKHVYEDILNHPVRINRSYWVLEPGAIQQKIPDMQAISIGPTEIGVYPSNYRIKVSDFQILYDVLKQILLNLKEIVQ